MLEKKSEVSALMALVATSSPILAINGTMPSNWCRNTQDRRHGPWGHKADYFVIDNDLWNRREEVLYFSIDASGQWRHVGSTIQLNDRWRASPMHNPDDLAFLGDYALFHSTVSPAIEAEPNREQLFPITVYAIPISKLRTLCESIGGPLGAVLEETDKNPNYKLTIAVEMWVFSLKQSGIPLWNTATPVQRSPRKPQTCRGFTGHTANV